MADSTVTVVGNLTRDPEVQTVGSGATLAKFTIASERSWKNESTGEWDKAVSYVDVITWRFTAEDVERLLEKGVRVVVTGRFSAPRAVDGIAGAATCSSLTAVVGRSMMAMVFSDYFNVRR